MTSLLRGLWKQGVSGQFVVVALCLIGVSGAVTLACVYIMVAYDLVLSHVFGLPNLDIVGALGVLMILAAIVGLFRNWGKA